MRKGHVCLVVPLGIVLVGVAPLQGVGIAVGLGGVGGVEDVDVDEVGVVLADGDEALRVVANHQGDVVAHAVAALRLAHAVDAVAEGVVVAAGFEGADHLVKQIALLLWQREGIDVAAPFQWLSLFLDVALLSEALGHFHPVADGKRHRMAHLLANVLRGLGHYGQRGE